MLQGPRAEVRRRKGCDTCRLNKVRCDEMLPICTRCIRLQRRCSWPTLELSLQAKRRGRGSLRSRDRSWAPAHILPASSSEVTPISLPTDDGFSSLEFDSSLMMDAYLASGELWTDIDLYEDSAGSPTSVFGHDVFMLMNSTSPNLGNIDALASPSTSDNSSSLSWAPLRLPFISDHNIPLPNSLILSSEEHNALEHYQTAFTVYRTTKDPKWSTHKLLLDLSAKNSMIMHFILAVSINDICHRQEHDTSLEAQEHFEAGTRQLIETIKKDSNEDYVVLMAGFLFLYLYMPKKKYVPRQKIQQLSMTVLRYVKRHNLDNRCLEARQPRDFIGAPIHVTARDRSILARLIIWTFDEDVKCGFQGAGGYLAEYLTAHRERTMAVYEVSRTALEAHWGSTYPTHQASDDDDNAIELEFLWALTALWQDINELENNSELPGASRRIEQRFTLLEKKYTHVFRNSATSTKPRTRVLINADYDVVLFNALKVYYFRTTIDLGIETLQDVEKALKTLIFVIQRTFVSKNNELHDRLQWPLFLAGMETDDGIYREWILSRITNKQARAALQQTIDHQICSGKRLAMSTIKDLLSSTEANETSSLEKGEHAFLESITNFWV